MISAVDIAFYGCAAADKRSVAGLPQALQGAHNDVAAAAGWAHTGYS
jgi:hypothetical protein